MFFEQPNVIASYGLLKAKYEDMFVGKVPLFEESPIPVKTPVSKPTKPKVSKEPKEEKSSKEPKSKKESSGNAEKKSKSGEAKEKKGDGSKKASPSSSNKKAAKAEPKPKKYGPIKFFKTLSITCGLVIKKCFNTIYVIFREKVVKQLTPAEIKQIEMEKRAKEREELKAQRKLVADFKKLWFKPKEDLEVEDLKVKKYSK